MLEDIAILTAGTVISEEVGLSLEKAGLDDLGNAKRVQISKENTTVIDGAGKTADIEGRVTQIRQQIEDSTSDYDKEKTARTGGQAGRRGCGYQGRRRDGDRDEGKEGPRRRRAALHPRRR